MDRALDVSTGLNVFARDADRNAEYICPNPECAKKVTPRAINGFFYQKVSAYFAHAPNVADRDCQYYVENNYYGGVVTNYLQIRPVKVNSFSQTNKNKIYCNYYLSVEEEISTLVLSINFNYCFGDFEGGIIIHTTRGEVEISNRINFSSNQIRKYEIAFNFNPKNIKFIGEVSSAVKSLISINSIIENNLNIFDGITGRLINGENIVVEKDYFVLIKKNNLISHSLLKFCNVIQSHVEGFDLYNLNLYKDLSQLEISSIEELLGAKITYRGPKIYLIDPMPIKIEDGGELIIPDHSSNCIFQLNYCSIDDIEFQFEGSPLNEFEIQNNTIDQKHIIKVNLMEEKSLTLYWKSSKALILRVRKESSLTYREKSLEVTFNNTTYNLLNKLIYSSLREGMEISLPNVELFPQLKIIRKNKKLETNSNTKFIYKLGDTIDGGNFGHIGSQQEPLNKKLPRDSKSINILKWLNANAMININNDDIDVVERKLINKFGHNSPYSMHVSYLKNKIAHDI